jgi:hypothetical protein
MVINKPTQLLKYKNILFDEWVEDEYGTWATMCATCLEKYKDRLDLELDQYVSGCCSVFGCNQADSYVDMRYLDFDINGVEFIDE